MILVDTSVWVDHFRRGNADLKQLLLNGEVVIHPFIVGELACGTFKNRTQLLGFLASLPEVSLPGHDEVLHFVELRQLWGQGIGWIDTHLLAAALMSSIRLWTLDRALHATALTLGVAR